MSSVERVAGKIGNYQRLPNYGRIAGFRTNAFLSSSHNTRNSIPFRPR